MSLNDKHNKESFFSVAFDLIVRGEDLNYDLFINSSSKDTKDHFVRIFPSGGMLHDSDIENFRDKYQRLYVLESQRNIYLKSLAAIDGVSDTNKAEVIKGSALKYLDNIFDSEKTFNTEVLNETIEGCRDSVESMVDVIQDYDVSQVQDLIASLSFHDFYTYDHSINVSMYCISLFKAIKPNATKEELVVAGLGGLLHDLGKVRIPTTILNSSEGLSDEEFDQIKKHPEHGKDLIEECHPECEGVDFETIKKVVYEHHENYNGSGYPNKVEGGDIHVMARVCAVADFFDAITTKRSYHESLKVEDALAVMERSVGRKLDPKIYEIFKTKVSNVVLKGRSHQELPDSFDPCMPHKVLPLQKIAPQKQGGNLFDKKDGENNFGKVSADLGISKKSTKKKAA